MKSKTEPPKRWEVVSVRGNWWLQHPNGRLVAHCPRRCDALWFEWLFNHIDQFLNRKAK